MIWRKANDGYRWVSNDGLWVIRKVTWSGGAGCVMFWLYHNGTRVNSNGSYESSVHFFSLRDAKKFAIEEAQKP